MVEFAFVSAWLKAGGSLIAIPLQYPKAELIYTAMKVLYDIDLLNYGGKVAYIQFDPHADICAKLSDDTLADNLMFTRMEKPMKLFFKISRMKNVAFSKEERKTTYASVRFYNHKWDDPACLQRIGVIKSDEIRKISNDLLHENVEVNINKIVYNYDQLVVIGPVFPHEVVGFSGGAKYFFPGISGAEITNFFHWFGALLTNLEIIGKKYTPVREVVNRAASFIQVPTLCFSLVIHDANLCGLYIGSLQESWSKAADLSAQVNIIYKERQFTKVLSMPSEMYDDLWTAAKAMYKLEPVVADGGTLIIYAPHLRHVSFTHGELIDKIGYHIRDYFLKYNDKLKSVPGTIKAHSTHVKGAGTFENGMEKPRINVVLATRVPKERCQKINLGYHNPDDVELSEWQGREDEGILLVKNAGEVLYRFKKGANHEINHSL